MDKAYLITLSFERLISVRERIMCFKTISGMKLKVSGSCLRCGDGQVPRCRGEAAVEVSRSSASLELLLSQSRFAQKVQTLYKVHFRLVN